MGSSGSSVNKARKIPPGAGSLLCMAGRSESTFLWARTWRAKR
jgi:hypothetical protein